MSSLRPDHALTSYYSQQSADLWLGGIGIHKFDIQDGTLTETSYDYKEFGGIFDIKVREGANKSSIVAASVEKAVLLIDWFNDDLLGTLNKVQSVTLEKSPVYVDMRYQNLIKRGRLYRLVM
jgi:hypothetical protein